jgi:hypothetical protein
VGGNGFQKSNFERCMVVSKECAVNMAMSGREGVLIGFWWPKGGVGRGSRGGAVPEVRQLIE